MMALFANAHAPKGRRFRAADFLPTEPRTEAESAESIMAKFDKWAAGKN